VCTEGETGPESRLHPGPGSGLYTARVTCLNKAKTTASLTTAPLATVIKTTGIKTTGMKATDIKVTGIKARGIRTTGIRRPVRNRVNE
jgi:hypothetical protein